MFNKKKRKIEELTALVHALRLDTNSKVETIQNLKDKLKSRHPDELADVQTYRRAYEDARMRIVTLEIENKHLINQIMNPDKKVPTELELALNDLLAKSNAA